MYNGCLNNSAYKSIYVYIVIFPYLQNLYILWLKLSISELASGISEKREDKIEIAKEILKVDNLMQSHIQICLKILQMRFSKRKKNTSIFNFNLLCLMSSLCTTILEIINININCRYKNRR